jgi:hypothetical protein
MTMDDIDLKARIDGLDARFDGALDTLNERLEVVEHIISELRKSGVVHVPERIESRIVNPHAPSVVPGIDHAPLGDAHFARGKADGHPKQEGARWVNPHEVPGIAPLDKRNIGR